MTTLNKRGRTPLDALIGRKLKYLRIKEGWSRAEFSKMCSVTHQQIQKYEKALNRISVSRLKEFAIIFNVGIGYFDQEDDSLPALPKEKQKEYTNLMKYFLRIENEEIKDSLYLLIKNLFKEQETAKKFDDTDL